jgi:hypothetical protein
LHHLRNTCLSLALTLALGTSALAQERDVDGWMESANFILGVYSAEDIIMPCGLYGAFGAATGAIEVGDRLWVSSTGA